MAVKSKKQTSTQEFAFWRAYLEILSERVPLVDRWSDGHVTWHPRVVQKLLWYSNISNTPRNRMTAHEWLMTIAIPVAKKRTGEKKPTRRAGRLNKKINILPEAGPSSPNGPPP